MQWQDRIRELDARLASGEITAAERRRLQDEVLAEASSATTGRPARSPDLPGSTAVPTELTPADDPGPAGAPADTTMRIPEEQIRSAASGKHAGGGTADAGTTGSTGEGEHSRAAGSGSPASAAGPGGGVAVAAGPGAGGRPGGPGVVAGQVVPTGTGPRVGAAGGDELRAPQRLRAAVAPVQGERVFTQAGGSGRRTALGAVAVLVVLGVLAGATWWWASTSSDAEQGGSAAPAADWGVARLPNPIAGPLSTVGDFTVQEGREYDLVKAEEKDYLTRAGTERIYFRAAAEGRLSYQLFLYQTPTAEGARRVDSGIIAVGERGGMVPAGFGGIPAGVTATKASDPAVALAQASYATEGGAVRVVVLQSGERDDAELGEALRRVVVAAAASLPVRTG